MSQVTKDKQIVISLEIVQTRVIFLNAQPQAVYYNCVKFHQYQSICLGEDVLTRNMNGETERLARMDLHVLPHHWLVRISGL